MNLSELIITEPQPHPRRVLVYGTHGIGKSTFAASSESPVVLQTEDGLSNIRVPRLPLATSLEQVCGYLDALATQPHDYATVVIDSLDWLERLVWAWTAAKHKRDSIESFDYGKGYMFAMDGWRLVVGKLDRLRAERMMQVVLTAHAEVAKFAAPGMDSFDRYGPKLHKHASAYVQEWCDEVLFATSPVRVIAKDEGFNRTRGVGVGTGERVLRTTERPSHIAKNRLGLPDEIPFDWSTFAAYRDGTAQGDAK